MTELETALVELATALEEFGLPFVLIGGLAVSLSGEPRGTLLMRARCFGGLKTNA